jgi:hypothetical protein
MSVCFCIPITFLIDYTVTMAVGKSKVGLSINTLLRSVVAVKCSFGRPVIRFEAEIPQRCWKIECMQDGFCMYPIACTL